MLTRGGVRVYFFKQIFIQPDWSYFQSFFVCESCSNFVIVYDKCEQTRSNPDSDTKTVE